MTRKQPSRHSKSARITQVTVEHIEEPGASERLRRVYGIVLGASEKVQEPASTNKDAREAGNDGEGSGVREEDSNAD